jgi:hypothetical protein
LLKETGLRCEPNRRPSYLPAQLATDRTEPFELRRYVAASVHREVGDGPEPQPRTVTALSRGAEGKGPVERLGVRVLSEPSCEPSRVGDACIGCGESADRCPRQVEAAVVELGGVKDTSTRHVYGHDGAAACGVELRGIESLVDGLGGRRLCECRGGQKAPQGQDEERHESSSAFHWVTPVEPTRRPLLERLLVRLWAAATVAARGLGIVFLSCPSSGSWRTIGLPIQA